MQYQCVTFKFMYLAKPIIAKGFSIAIDHIDYVVYGIAILIHVWVQDKVRDGYKINHNAVRVNLTWLT